MSKHNRERRLFWKMGLRKKAGKRFTDEAIAAAKVPYLKTLFAKRKP